MRATPRVSAFAKFEVAPLFSPFAYFACPACDSVVGIVCAPSVTRISSHRRRRGTPNNV